MSTARESRECKEREEERQNLGGTWSTKGLRSAPADNSTLDADTEADVAGVQAEQRSGTDIKRPSLPSADIYSNLNTTMPSPRYAQGNTRSLTISKDLKNPRNLTSQWSPKQRLTQRLARLKPKRKSKQPGPHLYLHAWKISNLLSFRRFIKAVAKYPRNTHLSTSERYRASSNTHQRKQNGSMWGGHAFITTSALHLG
ncbi:hypothetical protein NDU88_003642 [Pleurodeles waltl]|uniref:Uncharacterized protein n=1 Tax=Pleurodeles waltl TaxID=8319 RepID=A0AAV7NGZ0_PLEWA|nr:hypothetical protein NDU88_003642 [Pleurodeles waltl]